MRRALYYRGTRRPDLRRRVVGLFAMSACVLAMGCERGGGDIPPQLAPAVKTELVDVPSSSERRILSGMLVVGQETRLSFAVGGKLTSVPLREGESFTAGQVIARLDTADFEREVAAQEAQLASASSRLREAEDTFRRKETLVQKGVVSQAEFARAEAALATARSDRQIATVALSSAQENLRRTTLVAPRDGIVTRLAAKKFEEIAAGEPVYEVGSQNELEVLFHVPEHLVPGLHYDAPVTVTLASLRDRAVHGKIIEISAAAEGGNAFRVRARLDETPAGARSGMTASVALSLGDASSADKPAFGVPLAALIFDSTQTGPVVGRNASLFVFDAERRIVVRREIAVAGVIGNRVLVAEGLTPGERVVTAGVAFLRDGQNVRLWTPPE